MYDQAGEVCLMFALRLRYRLAAAPGKRLGGVETVAYQYQLEAPGEPPRQLLRLEWHPYVPGMTIAHVHPGEAVIGQGSVISERAHIPTGGFVTLKDVLGHAVRDFGVQPIRDNWSERLDRAHEALMTSLSWADPRA